MKEMIYMKQNKLLNYLLAIVLIIGLMLMSCEKEPQSNDTANTTVSQDENKMAYDSLFIITQNKVGPFAIGKKVPEDLPKTIKMRKFIAMDTDNYGKQEKHAHNVVFNQLEDLVELTMEHTEQDYHEDKVIMEMMVYSDYYETEKGISVGSTVQELFQRYEKIYAYYDNIHHYTYLETQEYVGVQFIISHFDLRSTINHNIDFAEIPINELDPKSVIRKIKVY
jgi:hypothetical protein